MADVIERPAPPPPLACRQCGAEVPPEWFELPQTYLRPKVCQNCVDKARAETEAQRTKVTAGNLARAAGFNPGHIAFLRTPESAPMRHRAGELLAQADLDAGAGIYLWGPHQTGKTTIATAIGIMVCKVGDPSHTVRFTGESDLVNTLRERSSTHGPSPESLLAELVGCYLLIFDDIGTIKNRTAAVHDWLTYIIDKRLRLRRPTIWTSNTHPDRLDDLFTGRDTWRLFKQTSQVEVGL